MKISEDKLREIVREEIRNVVSEKNSGKGRVDELNSFREDRMRAYLQKNPDMRNLYQRSDINDLKTFWDIHVHGNAHNEREYSHAL